MFKKSIAFILMVAFLFVLCACEDSDNKENRKKSSKDKSSVTEIDEIAPSFAYPEDNEDNDIIATIPQEEKLSKFCSEVLCTGYNGEDLYELVTNQIDGYPDSTFEFGVIKNNEWLLPMGSETRFINSEGWWAGASGTNEPGVFHYIGSNCFYYDTRDVHILYYPETNFSFDVWGLFKKPTSSYGHEYVINENAELFVRIFDPYHENKHPLYYVNMETGESKYIPLDPSDIEVIGSYSDGMFYAALDADYSSGCEVIGFFDLDGNQVIDLSSYSITDYKNYRFVDGQYTFTARNNSNVLFDITIDTTGAVVNQVKVEN